MTIYRSGKYKLSFSIEMNRYLNAHQQDFMQEDTQAGMIYAYLEDYIGDRVCSKQLYEEALGNLNSPADWETRAICEIMNTGIAGGIIQGWVAYKSPKRYKKYGSQKGWERVNQAPPEGDGFQEKMCIRDRYNPQQCSRFLLYIFGADIVSTLCFCWKTYFYNVPV